MEERGIRGTVEFINDWTKSLRGGVDPEGSAERYLLDVSAKLEGRKLLGWNAGTALVRLHHYLGDNGAETVGDAQGFSNIDAEPRTMLYELWWERGWHAQRWRVKLGKVDANTEFATVESGGDFLNSSMGYSPTILKLPTYPQPRPSVNLFFRPREGYSVALGLYDTAGAGAMPILELGHRWRLGTREFPGRVGVGFWRQTGRQACFDGDEAAGANGFYLVSEQGLWRSGEAAAGDEGVRSLSAFFQYGQANGEVSSMTRHAGGGVVWQGLLRARMNDSLGLGATWVRLSDEPEAGFEEARELALEVFYKLQIRSYLSISPDVQFIHHPGGLHGTQDAVVLTPRVRLSF